MFERAGRLVYRSRWTLLALTLAAAVLVAPLGLELFGRMADGGFEDPRADSTTAARWNDDWYGGHAPDVVVLYRHPSVKVRDARYKATVHDSLRALPGRHVRSMATYWTTGSKKMVSEDGHSTYAIVTLKGDRQRAYAAIADRLRNVDNLYVSVGGSVPLLGELNDQTAADLARAEAISMPVLLVLLVVVFGSLVAAGLPLVVGLLAVLGALVLLRLLTSVTEVSVFSLNVVTMLGLGLAIDYSLFVLKAFREEIARGATNEQAVVRTMATAGRTVAYSGLTVATALLGLLLFPQMFLRSIGLGAAAVVLVAVGAALVVLPAVLGVLGPRVNALRITPDFGPRREGGLWHAVASSVMRRPVLYLVAVSVVLVALAVPFLHVKFGNVDHRVLPAASESRRVAETLDRDFARNAMAAIDVHVLVERSFTDAPPLPGPLGRGHTPISAVTPVSPADVRPLVRRLERLPGVTDVEVAGLSQANGAVRLAVRYASDPMSDEARALVRSIRAIPPEPNVRRVVVGGPTAAQLDLQDSLVATLPWMALVVCSVTAVLLFAAFGSLVLPVKALLMNVLSIGASFGVIVWAFQDGHLAAALNFTSTGSIEATVTVLILAVVFGLSMDYELFLLSRVRAEWVRTGDNTAAVAAGLQQTGGVISSAALLLLVVIGAFSTAGITIVKLLGVGMFVAIVVDATLVRALLVPASMRLMGGVNWWLPRSWRAFHHRIALHEPTPASAPVPVQPPAPARLPTAAPSPRSAPAPAPAPAPRSARISAPASTPAPAPAPVPRLAAGTPSGGRLTRAIAQAAEGVPPAVTVNGRPAVFGADTDPVPLPAASAQPAAQRLAGEPGEGGQAGRRAGWVRVEERRARVVRGLPGGGWTWVEVDE
ncbi:MMPL family transporter [Nonomuraea rubra]|uniref:RND superfamily putative drug exporter n=1 Tax=Nonomuraea rubra TaxID=46180 RepID=A0A7X0NLI6_9ACTN|nr:MMPL family transporter [Nonomuraea rubra]MBB6545629.1 RND superfamily putative drug exporter [Nonomuraea rubra]